MGDEDKSFEASQQKLKKAREEGQVVKSRDLSTAIFLVVMFTLLMAMYKPIWDILSSTFIIFFEQIPHKHLEEVDWRLLLVLSARAFIMTVGPFLLIALMVAIAGEVIQVGLLITTKVLIPKPDKLNPINGFKNIFSKRSVIELVKNIIKILILAVLAVHVFQKHTGELASVGEADNLFAILFVLGEVLSDFIMTAGIAFFLIGGFDYLYQRNKFMNDQKMSFKEMKDEYKQSEGDPMVKHQLRQRRMQMMQRRMLEAVPAADVVVTNPIHVAVALKYDTDAMEAPQVVAKGAELFARRIKELAEQHGVPVVENPLVARTLYQTIEVDQTITPELYQTVAEILLFAWQLKGVAPPVAQGNGLANQGTPVDPPRGSEHPHSERPDATTERG